MKVGAARPRRSRPPMTVLIKFDPPTDYAGFDEIREIITLALEDNGLGNVHISKPITTWRDPARKKQNMIKLVHKESLE